MSCSMQKTPHAISAGNLFQNAAYATRECHVGSQGVPTDEIQIATDLYAGLQNFYAQHTDLQARPLFITGESYAGKYVPVIGVWYCAAGCSLCIAGARAWCMHAHMQLCWPISRSAALRHEMG